MTDCTERSEGQEGMRGWLSMSDCTERSEGQEGMRGWLSMTDCTERSEDCTERIPTVSRRFRYH